MKKVSFSLFLVAAAFSFSQVPSYVPTNGLVGWWPLNGNAQNSYQNKFHGQPVLTQSIPDRYGESNGAMDLSVGQNARIDFKDLLIGNYVESGFTLSFWCKSKQLTPGKSPALLVSDNGLEIGLGLENGDGRVYYAIDAKKNKYYIDRYIQEYDIYNEKKPKTDPYNYWTGNNTQKEWLNLHLDQWHHIAIVYTYDQCKLYFNGKLLENIPNEDFLWISDAQKDFWESMGKGGFLANKSKKYNWYPNMTGVTFVSDKEFKGAIDDFALWERALNTEEITKVYEAKYNFDLVPVVIGDDNQTEIIDDILEKSVKIKDDGEFDINFLLNGKLIKGKYKGQFAKFKTSKDRNDLPHGNGSFSCKYFQYTGNWQKGKFNGNGELIIDLLIYENDYSVDIENLTYSGEFKLNRRHGYGKMIYNAKSSYQGEWENDIIHGKGLLIYSNENVYEGEFVNGKRQGKGKMTFHNGEVNFISDGGNPLLTFPFYTGDWENDKIKGYGKMSFVNGDTLTGNWNGLQFTGWGKKNFNSGDFYEGEWLNSKITGKGKYYWKDLDRYFTGYFENNILKGEGVMVYPNGDVLTGDWTGNKFSGKGRRRFNDGNSYEGDWVRGNFNGMGTYTWQNGSYYTGNWIENTREGLGIFRDVNGAIWEGQFKNNIITGEITCSLPDGNYYTGFCNGYSFYGQGKMVYKNGDVYTGEWLNNVPHGKGKMIYSNNTIQEGDFYNGQWLNPYLCKEAKIGNQIWMAENLKVTKFRNGDPIPEAKSIEEWVNAGKNNNPAFCYVNNDPSTAQKYGILYNWFAVNDSRGLAPAGWKVPSNEDIYELRDFTQKHVYDQQKRIKEMEKNGVASELINVEHDKLDKYFLTTSCDLGGVRLFSSGQCFEYINGDLDVLRYCGNNKYGFNGQNEAYREDYNGQFVLPSPAEKGTYINGATYWSSSWAGGWAFVLDIRGRSGPLNSSDIYSPRNGLYDHWLENDNPSRSPSMGLPIRCIKN